MSRRTLLKKVNDLKVLEAQKAIEKQMELLQGRTSRRKLQSQGTGGNRGG